MQNFGEVPYDLEIVNLGSTFAKHGFDYRYFGKRGFNFAGQPQPLKDDHAILERYQDHLKQGAIVLVVLICPFVFSLYEYADTKPKLASVGYRKVKKIIKTVIGYNKMTRAKYEKLSVEEKSDLSAKNRVNGWKQEFSLGNTVSENPTRELELTFSKTRKELTDILMLCQRRGFRPVLMDMPAAKAEFSQFSQAFIRKFYDENLISANICNAPTLRYFGDPRFEEAALYENYADCFNDSGRKRFAEVLINDLKRLNIWEV